jgi:hypothetical protein
MLQVPKLSFGRQCFHTNAGLIAAKSADALKHHTGLDEP